MFDALEKWTRARIADKAHPVTELQLAHLAAEGEVTLETFTLDREKDLELQLQEAMRLFNEASQDHAMQHTRGQRYAVVALEGIRIIAQRSFRLRTPASLADIGETEPATNAGALALGMRLTESLGRTYMLQIAAQTEQMTRLMESTMARNSELEAKRLADIDLRENLLSQQHERDMLTAQMVSKERRMDQVIETLKPTIKTLLPDIVRKMLPAVAGSEGEHNETDAPFAKVIELFGSLTDEQQEILSKTLTPEQRAKLQSIITGDPK